MAKIIALSLLVATFVLAPCVNKAWCETVDGDHIGDVNEMVETPAMPVRTSNAGNPGKADRSKPKIVEEDTARPAVRSVVGCTRRNPVQEHIYSAWYPDVEKGGMMHMCAVCGELERDAARVEE